MVLVKFPYLVAGIVVKGFGRGSKELGIPTANFDQKVVDELPDDLECGVYYGWAQVPDLRRHTADDGSNAGSVHMVVTCVGWNPFYQNEKKSVETYLMNFDNTIDFYGSLLKVVITGYIRPQRNFTCKEELIDAIHEDLKCATEALNSPQNAKFRNHSFFDVGGENKHDNGYVNPSL